MLQYRLQQSRDRNMKVLPLHNPSLSVKGAGVEVMSIFIVFTYRDAVGFGVEAGQLEVEGGSWMWRPASQCRGWPAGCRGWQATVKVG
jgi:hypothetical protein